MTRRRIRPPTQPHDLTLDAKNANKGTPRGRRLLTASLKTLGAGRSIVVDRKHRVIGGNKTVEAAAALGIPLQVVPSDGRSLVVVQRTDLDLETDPRARELALADNRVAELDLEWDPAVLDQLRRDGINIDGWWTDSEWQRLMRDVAGPDHTEDAVLTPGPTPIQPGDLFAAGDHRVLCGDATDPATVARLLGDAQPVLMVTDPPYGVGYAAAWRHKAYPHQRTAVGPVPNDTRAAWPEAMALFPGDVAYVWHAAKATAIVATALEQVGFELRSQIIWQKSHFVLSRGHYHWAHEPAWYAVRKGASAHWCGDRSQSTVWSVPNLNPMGGTRTGENTPTGHSTQKPVRLFEIPILNHTAKGDAVYDGFVGSGTTLIAAERTGRGAFVMDILPAYVQVTLDRWEALTGMKARRIGRTRSRPRRS